MNFTEDKIINKLIKWTEPLEKIIPKTPLDKIIILSGIFAFGYALGLITASVFNH